MSNEDAVPSLTDVSRVQSLIAELDWCIANAHAGPRTAQAIEHARAAIAALAPTAKQAEAVLEPVDYDRVVSICDAHGIGLPVDCIEMVVEIIRHVASTAEQAEGVPAGFRVDPEHLRIIAKSGIVKAMANALMHAANTLAARSGDDSARLDWLQEEMVDTIYLDDGRIIDIAGRRTLRAAIDEAMAAPASSTGEQA